MCESQCNIRGTKAVADQPSEMITLKEDIASSQFDFLLIASPGWQTLGLLQKHRMGLKVEQFLWLFCFGFNTNINRFNLQASCRTCGTAEAIKRQRASKWNQIGSMPSVCSVWLQNQPQWIQLETKASCRTCGTAERASKWNTRLLSVMFWFQNQHQSIQLGLLENLWNCGSCEEAMSLKV